MIAKHGISLEKMILLDNSMICFAINLDNGISIPDFTGENKPEGEEDDELVYACQMIEDIFSSGANVQEALAREFKFT